MAIISIARMKGYVNAALIFIELNTRLLSFVIPEGSSMNNQMTHRSTYQQSQLRSCNFRVFSFLFFSFFFSYSSRLLFFPYWSWKLLEPWRHSDHANSPSCAAHVFPLSIDYGSPCSVTVSFTSFTKHYVVGVLCDDCSIQIEGSREFYCTVFLQNQNIKMRNLKLMPMKEEYLILGNIMCVFL